MMFDEGVTLDCEYMLPNVHRCRYSKTHLDLWLDVDKATVGA